MTLVILVGLFFLTLGAIVVTAWFSVPYEIWLNRAILVIWAVGLVTIPFKKYSQNSEVHNHPERRPS